MAANNLDMKVAPIEGIDRISRSRSLVGGDRTFFGLTIFASLLLIATLLALIILLVIGSWPNIQYSGFSFITSANWNPNITQNHPQEEFGILPYIFGTMVTSAIALIFAVPLAIGAALFIAEYAPRWLATPVSFMVELLAAIPSIIYGFWGLAVLVPIMYNVDMKTGKVSGVDAFLHDVIGKVPLLGSLFSTPGNGRSLLTAGLILAIMVLPTIMSVSREIILTVPSLQKEGMLALGATKWETIRKAVLPYAGSGIIGAAVLGLGRALGETMAVTLVIGNSSTKITPNLLSSGYTMSSSIAQKFTEAGSDPLYVGAIVEIALVLLIMTAIINGLARLLVIFSTSSALRGTRA